MPESRGRRGANAVEIQKLTGNIGAAVVGVDLSTPLDAAPLEMIEIIDVDLNGH